MNISEIQDAIKPAIVARDCFIVGINISKDNDIELTVEAETGAVTLDDCVEISRAFEGIFDREKEDYSLTVTSAGLDQPFRVTRQFVKAVGSEVEVMLKGGRKLKGTLTGADEDGFTLKYTARESVDGKKKKVDVEHEDRFTMDAVNAVRPHIDFK